jgi:hypothetical protein
LAPPE